MDERSIVRVPDVIVPADRAVSRPAANPFALGARAFSSPTAMALGLMLLAVAACGIALAGLLLLAGDGRAPERVSAGPQLAAALQSPPRGWSEPPSLPAAPSPAPRLAQIPTALAEPEPRDEPLAVEEDRPGEPVEGIPLPPRREVDEPKPFAGVWAPDAAACSPRQNHRGYLPAVINSEGAWAGETSCVFGSAQQTGSTWRFSAVCSNARRKWKADVRLTVTGDRLIWASQRGSQAYVRCARASRDT